MNEDAFRAFLATRLGSRSVGSYMSNARRVERVLEIELEQVTSAGELEWLEEKLRRTTGEFTDGSLADCLTVLRSYFKFAQRDICMAAIDEPVPAEISDPGRLASLNSGIAPDYSSFLGEASVQELLALHSGVIAELRGRGIVRTSNSPLGDYAEHLFAEAFGWKLSDNSSSGHDAALDGVRYQIKARRITPANPSRLLGAIRRLPEVPFDMLAAVLLDEGYKVIKAILIPHALVLERSRHVGHTNSWRLVLDDRWWAMPGITDVTSELRSAQI